MYISCQYFTILYVEMHKKKVVIKNKNKFTL